MSPVLGFWQRLEYSDVAQAVYQAGSSLGPFIKGHLWGVGSDLKRSASTTYLGFCPFACGTQMMEGVAFELMVTPALCCQSLERPPEGGRGGLQTDYEKFCSLG